MNIYMDPNSDIDKNQDTKKVYQKLLDTANFIAKENIRGKTKPYYIELNMIPYKLTDIEREIVRGAIGFEDKSELDRYEIYLCKNGEICVTSPDHEWGILTGREWMVNLSKKTARITRMS